MAEPEAEPVVTVHVSRSRCRRHDFRLTATYPDHGWALDYQFDVTADGRVLKLLHVVDEFTRESLSDLVAYSIDADATVAVLDARRPA